jgi:asparaginyl-tRNA synthetase
LTANVSFSQNKNLIVKFLPNLLFIAYLANRVFRNRKTLNDGEQMDYKVRIKIAQILLDDKIEENSNVTILGLVRSMRRSKEIAFLDINDGSCIGNLQTVFDNPDNFPVLDKILTGASVRVKGTLIPSQGKGQKYELKAESVDLVGEADANYPLQKKRHSFEFLREIAHLRPRTNTFGAVTRMRSRLAFAVHKYYQERGFYYIHTPIISTSDAEGAGDLFRVSTMDFKNIPMKDGQVDWDSDFFADEAFLTVSGQLEAEILAVALGDVYTFSPTFRAENSNTARHASEFWMIEPEMAWAELEDNMDLAEDFIKNLIRFSLEECGDDMEFFSKWVDKELTANLEAVMNAEFERVSYTDAVKTLEDSKEKFEYPIKWGLDMQTEHERCLTEKILKKPVIVYDYPEEIKPFYMYVNDDGKTVRGMDVLVPRVGEIIGGSQREHRLDVLTDRMNKKDMGDLATYSWYTDLRKYGTCPHSGFGLGAKF